MRVLIAGPPASGKSTLARLVADDIGGQVIDFDAIAAEFGSAGHEHPKAISERAHAEVARRMRLDGPAVLVKSAPDPTDREALAREFRADTVYVIPLAPDVAKGRAVGDGRPRWTADSIDKWWLRFEPSPLDTPLSDPTDLPALMAGLRPHGAVNPWLIGDSVSDEGTGNEGTEDQGGNNSGTTPAASNEWKPPATQEELNRIIADRVKRAESKFGDYKDAKTKAAQYDAMVEAQKTELQKIQERAEAAEKRAADLEAAEQKRQADAEVARQVADWKTQIAKATGVPATALRGTTKEDLQAHAEEIKALLPDPNTRRVGGAYVPTEGREVGAGGSDPAAEFGRILQNARRNAQ